MQGRPDIGFPTLCRPGMAGRPFGYTAGLTHRSQFGRDRMSSCGRPGQVGSTVFVLMNMVPPLRDWSSPKPQVGDALSEGGTRRRDSSRTSRVQFASGTVGPSGYQVLEGAQRFARVARHALVGRWRRCSWPQHQRLRAARRASADAGAHPCPLDGQLARSSPGGGEQHAPAWAPMANITGDRVCGCVQADMGAARPRQSIQRNHRLGGVEETGSDDSVRRRDASIACMGCRAGERRL